MSYQIRKSKRIDLCRSLTLWNEVLTDIGKLEREEIEARILAQIQIPKIRTRSLGIQLLIRQGRQDEGRKGKEAEKGSGEGMEGKGKRKESEEKGKEVKMGREGRKGTWKGERGKGRRKERKGRGKKEM